MTDEPGIRMDDLPRIYREGYLHAVESARAVHDPAADWEGFREYLWKALTQVFGLEAGGHDADVNTRMPREP